MYVTETFSLYLTGLNILPSSFTDRLFPARWLISVIPHSVLLSMLPEATNITILLSNNR